MAEKKPTLKAGDLVRFVLGGPVMIVFGKSEKAGGTVVCQWITSDGLYQRGEFLAQTLTLAPPPGSA